jgi:hypothetical protein
MVLTLASALPTAPLRSMVGGAIQSPLSDRRMQSIQGATSWLWQAVVLISICLAGL